VWVGEGVDGGGGVGQVDQVEVVDLGAASGGANLVGCPFGALAVGCQVMPTSPR
jgi:hypothetical protein